MGRVDTGGECKNNESGMKVGWVWGRKRCVEVEGKECGLEWEVKDGCGGDSVGCERDWCERGV